MVKFTEIMSPDVLNEIIEQMGQAVFCSILTEVHNALYFAIIADETRNISGKEQLAISLRWVSEFYVINEELIGLFCVDKTDADTLLMVLKDILIRCSYLFLNVGKHTMVPQIWLDI